MAFYIVKSSVTAICANNRILVRASDSRLWCSFLWASEVRVAYSDDDGVTWTLELVTTPATTVSYPTMAIDSADNIHVVWRQLLAPGDYHIHYRRRNALGVWDAEEVVSVDPGQQSHPTIAIDSSDNVHVVWESTSDPVFPMTHLVKYRMRTGVGWQAVESVSDPLPALTFIQRCCLAIGSDDVVHVAWASQGCGVNIGFYNIQYKQRTALGWQAQEGATDLAAHQIMPVIALDSSNDVHVVFFGTGWGANPLVANIRYAKRTAGVWGTYEAITDVVTPQNNFGSLRYHSIALDVAGDIHVVWSADGWGVNIADTNVQYRCKSGGVWQAQEGLTDRNTDQGSVSLIWAMHPTVGGVRTNIPFTGYAFILHGDDWGMDKVEYSPAPTLSWEAPAGTLFAFVAAYAEQTLTVINVTDPTNPIYVASVATDKLSKLTHSVGVIHGISYTADSLSCIDASIAPSVLGYISGGGPPNFLDSPRQLAVSGNYCYIAALADDGLTIINISNPALPTYAGGIYGAGAPNYLDFARAIAMLDSTHCCVTGWSNPDRSFNVIDVSNPAIPVIVGQTRDTDFVTLSMKISGNRAYLTNNDTDLIIVDVSDITNPTLISTTSLFTAGNHIDVVGNYAYVTDWSDNALYIVDISNPLLPFVAGSISGAGPPNYLDLAWGVHVYNNIAYVTAYNDNSLVLIDVLDPTNPTLLGVIRGSGAPNFLKGAEDVWVGEEAPPVPFVINKSYALAREEL